MTHGDIVERFCTSRAGNYIFSSNTRRVNLRAQ